MKRSMVQKKKEHKVEIPPKPEVYYIPTPSSSIPPRVARLCRIVNLERSLKSSLVLFRNQQKKHMYRATGASAKIVLQGVNCITKKLISCSIPNIFAMKQVASIQNI